MAGIAAPHAKVNPLGATWNTLARSPALVLLGLSVVLALVLSVPGETVTTRLLEELFAILDGVHRLAWGQVPNVDFHSAIGPLAYYVPGLGYWLTGSLGAALPFGTAVLLVLSGAIAAHVLPSRLAPGLALPLGLFLLLVLAVPMNLGDPVNALSFGQFYNRVGWVSLALLLVMFAPPLPTSRHPPALDALCAAGLTLLMLYSRASYGMVAVGFLLFMLTDRRQWLWAGAALLLAAIAAALIEVVWGGSLVYRDDVLRAFAAGGWLRGTPAQWLELFLANLPDYLLLGFLAGLCLWRRFDLRLLVFVVLCGLAGFWLLNQNDQRWGILTIHAASAVLAQATLRDMGTGTGRPIGPLVNPAGIKLYLFGFLFPTIVHGAIALSLHAGPALTNSGHTLAVPRLDAVRLADLWTPGEFGGSHWYLGLVEDGLSALQNLEQAPGRILVLGGPNPFSLALDLPPALGDVAQMRWGASDNPSHHIAPAQFLAGVDTVLERTAAGGIGNLGEVYMPFVTENFEAVANTANWRIFQRPADPL